MSDIFVPSQVGEILKVYPGRRVLQSYLLMFIHSSPSLPPNEDYERILEYTLNTYALGEHVAPKWELGKVLKWKPMNVGNMSKPLGPDVEVPSLLANVRGENARSVGMYKVHGSTVEAVVGGVFHQFVRTTFSDSLPSAHMSIPGRSCCTSSLPHPTAPTPVHRGKSGRPSRTLSRACPGDLRAHGRTQGTAVAMTGPSWRIRFE